MRKSCSCGLQRRRVLVLIAHQLTVTRRGAIPVARGHPPIEWETGNPRFNGKNASEINAIAVDTMRAEIWPGRVDVNVAGTRAVCPEIHHFDRFFALPRPLDWASVRPPATPV
jgi:hypothetical protein